jgi:hypothetical protein
MSWRGHCSGATASHLASTMQVACIAPHHAADGELHNVVLLVNSLTIWCILMVSDTMIKGNCQHYYHLASNLVCRFWPW